MTGPLLAISFQVGKEDVSFHLEQLLGLCAGKRDIEAFFLAF